jgi:hypothetical protein
MRAHQFAEGTTWHYRARCGEEGSLIKIHRIEIDTETGEEVFHISAIGLRSPHFDDIQHIPVSRRTLELSVTAPAHDPGQFPSCEEGIAIWREENGGVYAISIAEIVEQADFKPA